MRAWLIRAGPIRAQWATLCPQNTVRTYNLARGHILFTYLLNIASRALYFGSRPIPVAQLQSIVEVCPILSFWRKAGVEIELSREGGDTADMSAVRHSRQCLLCHTADESAVSHSRHVCCVTQLTPPKIVITLFGAFANSQAREMA